MPASTYSPSLADLIGRHVGEGIRQRGRHYFADGRVELQEVGDASARARVRGSGARTYYDVEVDWSDLGDGLVTLTCTCPYFEGPQRLCKHIWAMVLELDRRGHVTVPRRIERDSGIGRGAEPGLLDDEESDDLPDRFSSSSPHGLDPFGGSGYGASGFDRRDQVDWRLLLERVRRGLLSIEGRARRRQAYYVLENRRNMRRMSRLRISFYRRDELKSGGFGKLKPSTLNRRETALYGREDQALLRLLLGLGEGDLDGLASGYSFYDRDPRRSSVGVGFELLETVLPRLCATGRFGWLEQDPDRRCRPLSFDPDPPWRLRLDGEERDSGVSLRGTLVRDSRKPFAGKPYPGVGADVTAPETTAPGVTAPDSAGTGGTEKAAREPGVEEVPLEKPVVLFGSGWIFFEQAVGRLELAAEHFPWIAALRSGTPISIPRHDLPTALEEMGRIPGLPEVRLPEELDWPTVVLEPEPRMVFSLDGGHLVGQPAFLYGDHRFGPDDPAPGWTDVEGRRLARRDFEAEADHLERLFGGLPGEGPAWVRVPVEDFLPLAERLVELGWRLEAEGRTLRPSGRFSARVSSGIDWFGLSGEMDFDGRSASLPSLLEAARRGERFVLLDDGSMGLLPEDWLERFAPLAQVGRPEGEGGGEGTEGGSGEELRFEAHQALVLDALLAAEPRVQVDEVFERVRRKLRGFEGLEPAPAPPTFRGELRPYQEIGLAWMGWLAELGLGGCLADDMGLGKTIQVLALLEQRRLVRAGAGRGAMGPPRPSLLVVPRSLLHNWAAEAERFTPELPLHLYHGPGRKKSLPELHDCEDPPVIVTTYGTLRRDLTAMRTFGFDLVVLDEAQAIKNAASQTAKACRLVRGRHRLALTGTPVENHLGELWSLFEFLNPGMLGRLPSLASMAGKNRLPDESLEVVARAIRPLVLRRTKGEVLSDLPAKTEQTLHCELSTRERKRYDELLDHYRAALTAKMRDVGLGRAKIQVLEALLRLRQAACHGGLMDPDLRGESSAKLDVLVERLREVVSEGDKALVFSQFTKMLAIVRDRLGKEGLAYEYLDGRTRDRQAKVDRFQDDPDVPIFLISLKAGGVGLNLTAASYVFLLDPWWNPAVESQAIDRAHRIGQDRPVFAYRLIARGTVEEKILELQDSKRALADAIITQDRRLLRRLTADDLALLLGGPLGS